MSPRLAAAPQTLLIATLVLAGPGLAHADPCEGKLPGPGAAFSGLARYVGDGDGLCVGQTSDPAQWIEVRLANFYAPELNEAGGRGAKDALERITRGKPLRCVAGKRSFDRVVARCTLGGEDLGALLRRAGVREGGNGRR